MKNRMFYKFIQDPVKNVIGLSFSFVIAYIPATTNLVRDVSQFHSSSF